MAFKGGEMSKITSNNINVFRLLKNPKYQVSCHFLISRNGSVIQMVSDKNIAWHAGKSKWKKFSICHDFGNL